MLSHAIIKRVFAALADRFERSAEGCNRPIASWCYEPVAKRWSLHPFPLNPNSCLAPLSPYVRKAGQNGIAGLSRDTESGMLVVERLKDGERQRIEIPLLAVALEMVWADG
jgi:hypothetical protein